MGILFVILDVLLSLVFLILALILLSLYSQLEYRVEGCVGSEWQGSVRISILFRALSVRIIIRTGERRIQVRLLGFLLYKKYKESRLVDKLVSEERQRLKKRRSKKRDSNLDDLVAYFRYAADLFRWIRPKRLEVSGTLGFDDPLITGYMYAAQAWLNSSELRWHSDLTLLFDEVVFDVQAVIEGKVRLILLVWRTIRLFVWKWWRKRILRRQKKVKLVSV